ncbi:MAG: YihY family inner membrane protein [Gammaproteobacteria bacterium]
MNNRYLKWIKRQCEWLFYFTRYFFRQFYEQRGMQIASSLAYATLLSLVPLVTVALAFLQGLPLFEKVGETVQTFIFSNFVPTFGDTIQEYLQTFSSKASQLTVTGLTVLLVIALMLMSTIDNAFNTIWHVRARRSAVARFLVYWAIITLGPLLLGVGLLTSSYLLSLPLFSDVAGVQGLQQVMLSWFPFMTTTAAFTLMYILVPNCFVLRRHALAGGIVAAVLFELAKYAFGIYVRTVPTHETIYGALAVIPIFLIWIYTSWVVLLLGAHITFCLSSFRFVVEKTGRQEGDWGFEDAYRVIALLWEAQKQGRAIGFPDMVKQGMRIPQHRLNDIMECLHAADWVQKNSNGDWLLSRDMDDVTVLDLHRIVPKQLPLPYQEAGGSTDDKLASLYTLLAEYKENLKHTLSVPLSQVLENKVSIPE